MDVVVVVKTFIFRFTASFTDELSNIFKRFTHHWLLWVLPIILFFLISSIFSTGVMFDLPVGYVDQDKSILSKQLVRELDAGSHARLINYDNQLTDAEMDLKKGKIYALLYISNHFESDVLAGKQPNAVLYYNAIYYSAGSYSIADYSGLMTTLNTQYRMILAKKVGLVVPPMAKVNFVYDGLFNASGNSMYFQQFSATIHMIQLFVVTLTIHLLGKLPRQIWPSFAFIFGKLAPYTLWYTALLLVEIALLVFISGARVSSSPLHMLPISFFYVMAAQSIGVLLFTYTRSILTAYSLIGILVGLALTYSGVTIPEMSMPEVAQFISKMEPLTYALNALFSIFLRHVDFLFVVKSCAILMCYPVLTTILIRSRLVKRLQQDQVVI